LAERRFGRGSSFKDCWHIRERHRAIGHASTVVGKTGGEEPREALREAGPVEDLAPKNSEGESGQVCFGRNDDAKGGGWGPKKRLGESTSV